MQAITSSNSATMQERDREWFLGRDMHQVGLECKRCRRTRRLSMGMHTGTSLRMSITNAEHDLSSSWGVLSQVQSLSSRILQVEVYCLGYLRSQVLRGELFRCLRLISRELSSRHGRSLRSGGEVVNNSQSNARRSPRRHRCKLGGMS